MAKHTVVETSRLAATHWGAHIYSLIHDADLDNGAVGYVGDLSEDVDGRETYEFGVFDADTINKKRAVLVANTEWSYDDTTRANQALSAYYNKADIPFRAFDLTPGDDFAMTEDGFDASGVDKIEVGQYVILEADKTSLKIVADESATAAMGFVGKITKTLIKSVGYEKVDGEMYGATKTLYVVHVERNEVSFGE